jgi:hypothetical protein
LILLLALTWQAGQVYTHFANSARKTVRVFTHSLTLQAGQVDIHFSKMSRNHYRLLVKYFHQPPEKSEKNFQKILSEQRYSGL